MGAVQGARSVIAVVAASVVLFSSQVATPAHADPPPSPSPSKSADAKLKDAKAEVLDLEAQASEIGEDYDEAAQALSESKKRLKVLAADIAGQQKKVDALDDQVRAIAL